MRLTADLLQMLAVLAPDEGDGEADTDAAEEGTTEPTGEAVQAGEAAAESPTITEAQLQERLKRQERAARKAERQAVEAEIGMPLAEAKQLAEARRQAEEAAKTELQREKEAREASEQRAAAAEAEATKARREARFGVAATGKIRPEALANGLAFSVAEFPADGEDDFEAVVAALLEQHPYLTPQEATSPNPPSTRGNTGRTPPVKAAQTGQVQAILGSMGFKPQP